MRREAGSSVPTAAVKPLPPGFGSNCATGAVLIGKQVSRRASSATSSSGGCASSPLDPCCSPCAVPTACSLGQEIRMTDLHDCVKVICNNEACTSGRFMHRECFEAWEETVLSYLRSTGRARSWSEKQRLQNLWTKKGYDLTYKACACKCGRGHLRKDLDWSPPPLMLSGSEAASAAATGTAAKKKKRNRRKSRSDRPSLVILSSNSCHNGGSSSHSNGISQYSNSPVNSSGFASHSHATSGASSHPTALSRRNSSNNSITSQFSSLSLFHPTGSQGLAAGARHRNRTSSMSSSGSGGTSSGGASPPIFAADLSRSPDLKGTSVRKLFFGESDRNRSSHCHAVSQVTQQQQQVPLPFRERSDSGTTFGRRPDYSTFNVLPRVKINSYHIRMEDETSHGNDDIRTLILSTLSSNGMNRVHCIVCNNSMPIFERFPLIDGTFFLSPRQHSKAAVKIVGASIERKYLSAVCMGCLEGWNSSLRCRSCRAKWDGSHLILGSMYSYDIFAAVPCCMARLSCSGCGNLAVSAGRRLQFFSDYSQNVCCSHCGLKDFHFVKPLFVAFMPSNAPGGHLVMKP